MAERETFIGRQSSADRGSGGSRLHDRLFGGDGPAGLPRFLLYGLRVAYLAYREFIRDFCWDRAASLTFTTIISLLPIAVLTLSVFGLFVEDAQLQRHVKAFMDRRLEAIFADDPPQSAPPEKREAVPAEGSPAPAERGVPEDIRNFVDAWVDRYVSSAIFRVDVTKNLVAIATLIVASLALLVSMERVFNRIWKAPGTRSYFQKFVTFWMILTTSPLLVAATFLVDRYTREGTAVAEYMKDFGILDFCYGYLVPFVISCLAFTFANLFLPKPRVRWVPALVGGCFSGSLWLVLKSNFYVYTGRAIEMRSFYGSLGIVPIFLVFLYLSWLVILAGGELSYTVQNYRLLMRAQVARGRPSSFSPPFLGLFILDRILGAFTGGVPAPPLGAIAAELDVETDDLEPVVDCLVEQGVLVACADESARWTLARDPASVPLDGVIAGLLALSFREEDPRDRPTAAHDLLEGLHGEARRGFLAAFEGRRLIELGSRVGVASGPPGNGDVAGARGSPAADRSEGVGPPEGASESTHDAAAPDRDAASSSSGGREPTMGEGVRN